MGVSISFDGFCRENKKSIFGSLAPEGYAGRGFLTILTAVFPYGGNVLSLQK